MTCRNPTTYSHDEWTAEAQRRFGKDPMVWQFVCPVCGHVTTVQDWKDAGAPETAVAFSCVGRWLPDAKDAFGKDGAGPCNYAGGGLIRLNPVEVTLDDGHIRQTFDFAPEGSRS
jgi:hypothetical protein